MKKILVFLLFILVSCQKEDIFDIEPYIPNHIMVFEKNEVKVTDNQDISFDVISSEIHQLVISTQDGSVLTKENFQPEIGINTRKIFTKILPKELLNLSLQNSSGIVGETTIIVE